MKYLALLRGINVGGNNKLSMLELKQALSDNGFSNASTYINSGNVLFESTLKDTSKLTNQIERLIKDKFDMKVPVVLFTHQEWQSVIEQAPDWWGTNPEWRHNLLVLLKPFDIKQAVKDFGELKPDIEFLAPGNGVMYQSMSAKFYSQTTYGKIAGKPLYKTMTIRNYNTATKLLSRLED